MFGRQRLMRILGELVGKPVTEAIRVQERDWTMHAAYFVVALPVFFVLPLFDVPVWLALGLSLGFGSFASSLRASDYVLGRTEDNHVILAGSEAWFRKPNTVLERRRAPVEAKIDEGPFRTKVTIFDRTFPISTMSMQFFRAIVE